MVVAMSGLYATMAAGPQSAGLALRLGDIVGRASGAGPFSSFAAAGFATGPLAATCRGGALKFAGRLGGAGLATAGVASVLADSWYTAAALAPAACTTDYPQRAPETSVVPKSVLSLFHPYNLFYMLLKNAGLQFMLKLNVYMGDLLEHEKESIIAEEQGQPPPPTPPMPDMVPAFYKALSTFGRELAVNTTRRMYEHIAVLWLGLRRAQPFLRDSRAYIKQALSPKLQALGASALRRFYSYTFVALHAQAFYYAADCTVAAAMHSYRACTRRSKPGVLLYWAKGVGLQLARCVTTYIMASLASAAGSLARPGTGTFVGMFAADTAMAILWGMLIDSALLLP